MISRTTLELDSRILLQNFEILSKCQPWAKVIPMVKANAYGHDAAWVSRNLNHDVRVYAFGVATLDEAKTLRSVLSKSARVIVFSDSAPWTEEVESLCLRYNLEPVFTDFESFLRFQSRRQTLRIPFHLEFNSGMNRLGLDPDFLRWVKRIPDSVFSHLADAENPKSTQTQSQLSVISKVFDHTRKKFAQSVRLHFQNSAGVLLINDHPLSKEAHLIRPGLSLYGTHPLERLQEKSGLLPVMKVTAPVLQIQHLERGDRIGYGGTYKVGSSSETIATLGAGYADGVFRAASNKGCVWFSTGKKRFSLPIVGRVSMDLTTVKIPKGLKLKVGDRVLLWGLGLNPHKIAKDAGTISYEWTTRIGGRVARLNSLQGSR